MEVIVIKWFRIIKSSIMITNFFKDLMPSVRRRKRIVIIYTQALLCGLKK